MQKFCAKSGCTFCDLKGTSVVTGTKKIRDANSSNGFRTIDSKSVRFLFNKRFNYRTKKTLHTDAKLALEQGKPVNGVKGLTLLFDIPLFDPCANSPVDYMHHSLLGITKKLLSIWFDSPGVFSNFFEGRKTNIIKKNLMKGLLIFTQYQNVRVILENCQNIQIMLQMNCIIF